MTPSIESITATALTLALDAASLRHEALASNIAHANTPGYRPLAVNFESQLEEARLTLSSNGRLDAAALADVVPLLQPLQQRSTLSGQVTLDVEALQLAQNGVQFQALLKGLNRHYQILSAATSDGKK